MTTSFPSSPPSCPTSGASTCSWDRRLTGEGDPIVKTEIEAAETLADLAELAMRESSAACDSENTRWISTSKSKRGRRRVDATESSSPSVYRTVRSSVDIKSVSVNTLDLSEGQAVGGHQMENCQSCGSIDPSNAEQNPFQRQDNLEQQDFQLHKGNTSCVKSCPSTDCGRPRRNLTEEEKEARRIRRVLANRESARQTIRRRQVMCEELTRKAAELATENENLIKEKDLALQQFKSLETTNRQLKEHMTSAIKTEAEKDVVPHKSILAGNPIHSSTRYPLVLYSPPPIAPLFWPTIGQSSYPVHLHHGGHGSHAIHSNISVQDCPLSDSCEHSNYINDNGGQMPVYVLPYPWFLPLPDYRNGQTSFSVGVKEELSSSIVNDQYSPSSSSNKVKHVDNPSVTLPVDIRKEAFETTEIRRAQEHRMSAIRFSSNGNEHRTGSDMKEISSSCLGPASSNKCENVMFTQHPPKGEAASVVSHNACTIPEKKQEDVTCSSGILSGAVAAAKARKRRKELTKLKIHGRQCRMN